MPVRTAREDFGNSRFAIPSVTIVRACGNDRFVPNYAERAILACPIGVIAILLSVYRNRLAYEIRTLLFDHIGETSGDNHPLVFLTSLRSADRSLAAVKPVARLIVFAFARIDAWIDQVEVRCLRLISARIARDGNGDATAQATGGGGGDRRDSTHALTGHFAVLIHGCYRAVAGAPRDLFGCVRRRQSSMGLRRVAGNDLIIVDGHLDTGGRNGVLVIKDDVIRIAHAIPREIQPVIRTIFEAAVIIDVEQAVGDIRLPVPHRDQLISIKREVADIDGLRIRSRYPSIERAARGAPYGSITSFEVMFPYAEHSFVVPIVPVALLVGLPIVITGASHSHQRNATNRLQRLVHDHLGGVLFSILLDRVTLNRSLVGCLGLLRLSCVGDGILGSLRLDLHRQLIGHLIRGNLVLAVRISGQLGLDAVDVRLDRVDLPAVGGLGGELQLFVCGNVDRVGVVVNLVPVLGKGDGGAVSQIQLDGSKLVLLDRRRRLRAEIGLRLGLGAQNRVGRGVRGGGFGCRIGRRLGGLDHGLFGCLRAVGRRGIALRSCRLIGHGGVCRLRSGGLHAGVVHRRGDILARLLVGQRAARERRRAHHLRGKQDRQDDRRRLDAEIPPSSQDSAVGLHKTPPTFSTAISRGSSSPNRVAPRVPTWEPNFHSGIPARDVRSSAIRRRTPTRRVKIIASIFTTNTHPRFSAQNEVGAQRNECIPAGCSFSTHGNERSGLGHQCRKRTVNPGTNAARRDRHSY